MERAPTWLIPIVVAIAASACRNPTQLTLEITTDVPCVGPDGGLSATETAVFASSADMVELVDPAATTLACSEGGGVGPFPNRIGSIVVVPSGDKGDQVNLRVTTALGAGDVSTCRSNPKSDACTTQSRRIRFLPHEELFLPIQMIDACRGVACSENMTCVASGRCVPDYLDANRCLSPGGCSLVGSDGCDAGDDCAGPLYGVNLVINGDCEDPGTLYQNPPPGWKRPDNDLGGACLECCEVAPHSGKYRFGMATAPHSELYQDIPLGAYATEIDSKRQSFGYRSWFASFGPDQTQLVVELWDELMTKKLAQADTGPIADATWTEHTGVLSAPSGTRFARVRILSTTKQGSEADGHQDDIELWAVKP